MQQLARHKMKREAKLKTLPAVKVTRWSSNKGVLPLHLLPEARDGVMPTWPNGHIARIEFNLKY
jgi:hypothetical protein